MTKTIVMLVGLGGVFAAGIACMGLFAPQSDRSEPSRVEACAGLSGQAKIDCEQRQER
jgi:hypothetical protein